jgi:hypothetical protein
MLADIRLSSESHKVIVILTWTECPAQVWDYPGDGYVHRLIQSNLDGKLVEVPSPEPPGMRTRASDDLALTSEQAGVGSRLAKGGPAASVSGTGNTSNEQARSANDDMNMLEVRFDTAMGRNARNAILTIGS